MFGFTYVSYTLFSLARVCLCVLWQGSVSGLPMNLTFHEDIQTFVSCILAMSSEETIGMNSNAMNGMTSCWKKTLKHLRHKQCTIKHTLKTKQRQIPKLDLRGNSWWHCHVKFQDGATVQVLPAMKFVDILWAWVKFEEWKHGFDPMEDTQHYSLVLTPSFPGLPKEFIICCIS